MTFGDGIRRNIAKVSPDERNILKKAFIALNTSESFALLEKEMINPLLVVSHIGSNKMKYIKPHMFMEDQPFCLGIESSVIDLRDC
ncbi:MAG: hypothetical protein WCF03_03760 [Nitrososphaeraceae archaeon]